MRTEPQPDKPDAMDSEPNTAQERGAVGSSDLLGEQGVIIEGESVDESSPPPHMPLIDILESCFPSLSSWLKRIEGCEKEMNHWGGTARLKRAMEAHLDQWRKDGRPEISWPECRRQLGRSVVQGKESRLNNPYDDVSSPNG